MRDRYELADLHPRSGVIPDAVDLATIDLEAVVRSRVIAKAKAFPSRDHRTASIVSVVSAGIGWHAVQHPSSDPPFGRATFSHKGRRGSVA